MPCSSFRHGMTTVICWPLYIRIVQDIAGEYYGGQMSNILMLDLGGTLIRDMQVLPGVAEALTALSELIETSCLVSDFEMPASPTPAKIEAVFQKYLHILDEVQLRAFFAPVAKRVTLSTHAGVLKPNRLIFEKALERLGVAIALSNCIFITEEAEHIRVCRDELGMKTLQFGKDFTDWSRAPLLVLNLLQADVEPEGGVLAQNWVPLESEELGDLNGIQVLLPASENPAEAVNYVRGLVNRGEISTGPNPLATHQVVTDASGRRFLKRIGFH